MFFHVHMPRICCLVTTRRRQQLLLYYHHYLTPALQQCIYL